MSDTPDLTSAVFAKTETGQQEIQTRALGLSPLVRRILVLADGKKTGAELAVFLPSADGIHAVLEQLLSLGCLRAEVLGQTDRQRTHTPVTPAAQVTQLAQSTPNSPSTDNAGESFFDAIPGLPSPELRSAKDNEMARNFMINSINAIIGQQMRISLITDIANAKGTEGLRRVYLAWQASMADHSMGKKRLPELTEKLFKVL